MHLLEDFSHSGRGKIYRGSTITIEGGLEHHLCWRENKYPHHWYRGHIWWCNWYGLCGPSSCFIVRGWVPTQVEKLEPLVSHIYVIKHILNYYLSLSWWNTTPTPPQPLIRKCLSCYLLIQLLLTLPHTIGPHWLQSQPQDWMDGSVVWHPYLPLIWKLNQYYN